MSLSNIFLKIPGWLDNMINDINIVLSIIGFFSILITIIRFVLVLRNNYEWIDNIKIEEFPSNHTIELGKGIRIQSYTEPNSKNNHNVTQNLITPQNNILRNVRLKKRMSNSPSKNGKYKYKTINTFAEITPYKPLCLILERSEGIPLYMLEWTSEYGCCAQYYFSDNLYDGDNTLFGFNYKFGFWAKVRKILDFK